MFDTLKIDSNTKLIDRYSHYDQTKTYKRFNFYTDNPTEIKAVLRKLTTAEETINIFATNPFRISIVQNNMEKKTWLIHPDQELASYDGHTYKFNSEVLRKLHKKYPFDYKFEKKIFSNSEYKKYLAQQKADANFLFAYSPTFRYEGSFDVQFPKNEIYSSPKAISDFLKPLIEHIVAKGEYSVVYIANEKNLNSPNQYAMRISSSKKLFDHLKIDGLKNENWELTVEDGTFFI
jgi:hypothetical protein